MDESERTVNTAGAKDGTMLRTRRHSDLRPALMRSTVGKLIIVMLATVLIAQTCNAQVSGSSGSGGRKGHQQKADKPAASAPKANDKAYNAALKSLPDKPFDPWRGAR